MSFFYFYFILWVRMLGWCMRVNIIKQWISFSFSSVRNSFLLFIQIRVCGGGCGMFTSFFFFILFYLFSDISVHFFFFCLVVAAFSHLLQTTYSVSQWIQRTFDFVFFVFLTSSVFIVFILFLNIFGILFFFLSYSVRFGFWCSRRSLKISVHIRCFYIFYSLHYALFCCHHFFLLVSYAKEYDFVNCSHEHQLRSNANKTDWLVVFCAYPRMRVRTRKEYKKKKTAAEINLQKEKNNWVDDVIECMCFWTYWKDFRYFICFFLLLLRFQYILDDIFRSSNFLKASAKFLLLLLLSYKHIFFLFCSFIHCIALTLFWYPTFDINLNWTVFICVSILRRWCEIFTFFSLQFIHSFYSIKLSAPEYPFVYDHHFCAALKLRFIYLFFSYIIFFCVHFSILPKLMWYAKTVQYKVCIWWKIITPY